MTVVWTKFCHYLDFLSWTMIHSYQCLHLTIILFWFDGFIPFILRMFFDVLESWFFLDNKSSLWIPFAVSKTSFICIFNKKLLSTAICVALILLVIHIFLVNSFNFYFLVLTMKGYHSEEAGHPQALAHKLAMISDEPSEGIKHQTLHQNLFLW